MTAAVSARGGSLSWTEQRIGGFPASLDLGGSQVKYAYAPASIAAGINRVTASAPLYYPGRITAAFVGPVVFDSPEAGIAVSASWLAATAGVDVGLSGLIRAGTSIDGLAVEQTGTPSADSPPRGQPCRFRRRARRRATTIGSPGRRAT